MVYGWPRLATTLTRFTRPLRLYFLLLLVTNGFLGSSSFEIARNKILGRVASILDNEQPSSRHHSRPNALPPDVVASILLSATKAGPDMDIKEDFSMALKESLARLRKDSNTNIPWAPVPPYSRESEQKPIFKTEDPFLEDSDFFESNVNLHQSRTGKDSRTPFVLTELPSDISLPRQDSDSTSSSSSTFSSASSIASPKSPVLPSPATNSVASSHSSSSSSSSSSSVPSSSNFPSSSAFSKSFTVPSPPKSKSVPSSFSSSLSFPSSSSSSSSSSPSSSSSSIPSSSSASIPSSSSASIPSSSSSSSFSSSTPLLNGYEYYQSVPTFNEEEKLVDAALKQIESVPKDSVSDRGQVVDCDPQRAKHFCLNGGRCIHTTFFENHATCDCPKGYKGRRCETIDFESFLDKAVNDYGDEQEEEEEEEQFPTYTRKRSVKEARPQEKKAPKFVTTRVQIIPKLSARW